MERVRETEGAGEERQFMRGGGVGGRLVLMQTSTAGQVLVQVPSSKGHFADLFDSAGNDISER